MEIKQIKQKLSIWKVLHHYGIKPDKNNQIKCPFHDDKTPSMKIYPETNTYHCFGCGKTGDQIQFIQDYEKTDTSTSSAQAKHQAILKAKSLINGTPVHQETYKPKNQKPMKENYLKQFTSYKHAIQRSPKARDYTEKRHLNINRLEIGYNSGTTYKKMKNCLIFPLKNKENQIVSFYGRSIKNNQSSTENNQSGRHYYITGRTGLYPEHPKEETENLILTESVIDAATLLQYPKITEKYTILACYGTNGLKPEHIEAIKQLPELREIIFFFDGDKAGTDGVNKYSEIFKTELKNIKISTVQTPENEDINSLLEGHQPEIYTHLINNRKELPPGDGHVFFSTEKLLIEKLKEPKEPEKPKELEKLKEPQEPEEPKEIETKNHRQLNHKLTVKQYKITYQTKTATYHIKGSIPKAPDSMKITLETELPGNPRKSRTRLDLYEDKQVEKTSRAIGEKLDIRSDLIEQDLNRLTTLLDEHREKQLFKSQANNTSEKVKVPSGEQKPVLQFLKQKELMKNFNKMIEKAGITGETDNRIFLFVIASAYKMYDTLHALVQGSSGSGKTYLIKQIADLMPPEDVIKLTRLTESSFYNFGENELSGKLLIIEDIEGLKEEAEYAFRELQSNGEIISGTSVKNEQTGEFNTIRKKVKGPVGSICTTTKGEIYEDNMSRIFLLAIDESKEQTDKIIKYLNQKSSGMINKTEEKETKKFIQNCIRMLKPHEVINPYADKILLPPEAHKIRRLTELFHAFINQITLINQYKRKKDKAGRLITEKQDIQTAVEIMFESIILKIDELDGSLRQFYENLKTYVKTKGEKYEFTRLEIRKALKISKSQQHTFFTALLDLEYIRQTGGHINRGFKYRINYWDNNEKLRTGIRTDLENQLKNL